MENKNLEIMHLGLAWQQQPEVSKDNVDINLQEFAQEQAVRMFTNLKNLKLE